MRAAAVEQPEDPSLPQSAGGGLTVCLIAAVAENGCIGKDNDLPWHIPEDLQRFKFLTASQTVVMGRKTYDSIIARLGKPLPGRRHWVLTRQTDWQPAKAHAAQVQRLSSLAEAIDQAHREGLQSLWVIGGADIYTQALGYADVLELTEVGLDVDGDAFFPDWGTMRFSAHFSLQEEGPWKVSGQGPRYRFLRFARSNSRPVAAVILAAGQGSRMGNRPKSLIAVNDQPLILRLLATLRASGIDQISVVLGYYADEIAAVLSDSDLTILRNPQPERGQASSQKIGLGSIPHEAKAVMVVLADQPYLEKEDLQQLLSAFEKRPPGTQLVFPSVCGIPGNPVMMTADLARFFAQQDPPVEGRRWRAENPQACLAFESNSRHFIEDLDTPEDLAALQASRRNTVMRGPQ
ncbi:MAG: dihydrofolate reductase [Burkholderiaceae bacterium]